MYFRFQNKVPYEKALIFAKDIFNLTGKFPDYEKAGVIKQLRAMGISAVQDLAESYVSRTPEDSTRGLDRSVKTVAKIAATLDLCHMLGYITSTSHHSWVISCEDLSKQLEDLRRSPTRK